MSQIRTFRTAPGSSLRGASASRRAGRVPRSTRRVVAAALLLALAGLSGCRNDAPAPGPAAPAAPVPAPAERAPRLVPWDERLDRWTVTPLDVALLTGLWTEAVEQPDHDRMQRLLLATAARLAELRATPDRSGLFVAVGRATLPSRRAALEGQDPRHVLPIGELLWDARDAASVLRLAERFGGGGHAAGWSGLRSAASQVAEQQPAWLEPEGSGCDTRIDGEAPAGVPPWRQAPGLHEVACHPAAPTERILRGVAPSQPR